MTNFKRITFYKADECINYTSNFYMFLKKKSIHSSSGLQLECMHFKNYMKAEHLNHINFRYVMFSFWTHDKIFQCEIHVHMRACSSLLVCCRQNRNKIMLKTIANQFAEEGLICFNCQHCSNYLRYEWGQSIQLQC